MMRQALRAVSILVLGSTLGAACAMPLGNSELGDDKSTKDEKNQTSKPKTPKDDTSSDAPAQNSKPVMTTPPDAGTEAPPLAPLLSLISPSSATQGAASQTITVAGSNFAPNAVVKFQGQTIPATLSGSNSLTATLSQANLATPGSFPVVVSTAGVDSNPIMFTVVARNVVVRVTSLSPSTILEASNATTLTVTGTDFEQLAKVLFNGTELATTFVSATTLTATIPAASLTRPGSFPVAVSSNGQTSAPSAFTVTARPVPTLTSIDPTAVLQGRGDTVLTARGTNYDTTTRVAIYSLARPNGVALTPTSTTPTQALATVPALHFSQAGTVTVKVYNLLPNATGAYATQSFAITVGAVVAAGPTLTASSPSAWIANSAGTVTLTGTGFTPQSVVEFDAGLCTTTNTNTACRTNAPTTTGATTITFYYKGVTPPGNIAIRVLNGTSASNAILVRLAVQ